MKKHNPSRDRYSTLPVMLRQFRIQAGFSQQNVADILNVSRSTYTYYETGKTTPDPNTLNRIAQLLGVSLEDFFPDEPIPPPASGLLCDYIENRRSPKKVRPDPQKIGELTAGEKAIVAFLRDRNVPTDRALDVLKDFFELLDEDRKIYKP